MARLQRRDDLPCRLQCVALEIGAFQRSGPTVEQLDHFCTCGDLGGQIFNRCLGQKCNQRIENCRVRAFQPMRRTLIRGALPRDHIGCDGPWRACKADQRRLLRQGRGKVAHGLIDRRQGFVNIVCAAQPGEIGLTGDGGQARPLAVDEPQIRAQRLRHQQDVGEKDRGVKTEAPNGLQRHFGCQIGVIAQRQEITGLAPGGLVFGQISSSLAHHPDRRHRQGLARQCAQDCLV